MESKKDTLDEKGRILIVDDSEAVREMMGEILGSMYQVDLANHGRQGLEKIQENLSRGFHYNLLLTDLNMPVMDGYSLLESLYESGINGPMSKMVMSGNYMSKEDISNLHELGVKYFFQKRKKA